jgi:hypothetical protein
MSVALIDVLLAALAAWFAGLWLGERGRRKAAEAWKVYGTPDAGGPASVFSPSGASSAGLPPGQFTDDALERGAAWIKANASSEGFRVTDEEAREQARGMLAEAARR